jgi:hypothetical protein
VSAPASAASTRGVTTHADRILERGETRMQRTVRSIVFALVAVLASAAVASADMCLTFSHGFGTAVFVAQNFSKPGVGACKSFLGTSLTFPFAGVACTTSDNRTLRIGFTWYGHFSTEHYDIDLPLPSLTGTTWTQTVVSSLGVGFTNDTGIVALGECTPRNLPVQ